ncbi:SRPBCC family protein [Flaviaesturariibacter terrae]
MLTTLLVAGSALALLLLIALFLKREHYVRRQVVINAPRQQVFDYVKLLRNQDNFNKHAMAGADRGRTFTGTDGTVGYIYAWSGDKSAGVGEKEIIAIEEGARVEAEVRFVKPMRATARIVLETEALSDRQTRVSWSNRGTLGYPLNLLVPMLEKNVAKDMDSSLGTLKRILETDRS